MSQSENSTPVERSEDDEENDAYRAMIRQQVAAVAEWAAMCVRDDEAFRRKVALARTQKDAERCPCGIMTLARAEARGRSSDHDPSCPFYEERAIII